MKNRDKNFLIELLSWLVIVSALVILTVFVGGGCKVTEYVEVPRISHDTVTVYNTRVDSIRFYDSISVKGRNDTVFVEKFRYRDRYHYLHDSIYLAKTDTITRVEIRKIEKPLTKWQATKMKIGGWSLGILLALIVGGAVYLFMKLKP